MEWQITKDEEKHLIVLPAKIAVHKAGDFFKDIASIVKEAHSIEIDASNVQSLHTAILQALCVLFKNKTNCFIISASDAFCRQELLFGFQFPRKGDEKEKNKRDKEE